MSFAIKLTRNTQDAQDLVQETVIKAYKNFHTYTEENCSSFKNWSFTILKNTFITKYRKRKRMSIVSTPVEEMLFAVSPNIIASEEIYKNDSIVYLNQCIDKLSKASKQVFKLYLNGYSYEEIAKVHNIPMGTVKSRINYARRKLQTIVDKSKILSH